MLLKALVAFVPASLIFCGAAVLFYKRKTLYSALQLVGAAGLVMVVFAHVCEALQLFPSMQWGSERSAGHYFDLCSALLGFTLFPLGYVLDSLKDK